MSVPCRSLLAAARDHCRSSASFRVTTPFLNAGFKHRDGTTRQRPRPRIPRFAGIVDQISQLTLLETADLVSSLKSRLNIPDLPVGGFAAAAPAAAPAAAEEADEPAPAAQEKTLFTLKLTAFDAAAKAKIIKEVKSLLGLSLVDSKKFVESAPKTMKESVPKEEAEKIVATMKELGATVVMD
ncbi:hypothetical protein NUW58_g7661 [Xylaria curta]|uniref:Uncharacterized protein n=1 Tax=Xylaria curta TaxID=42375 RepID=A0ACC1NFT2_9PEZI|nr:hypothetical protein NUW58_g7661 [Xylaria curta]